MTKQPCQDCKGVGYLTYGGGLHLCPMCEGSKEMFDPGVEYTYEMGPLSLIGGQTQSYESVQVLNYDFRAMFLMAVYLFPFTSQIVDSKTGQQFSNQQVHNLNLWGTAENPMPVLTPYVFRKGSQIQVNITDLGGGSGTAGVTNGSPNVTSVTGTGFNTQFNPNGIQQWKGQTIVLNGVSYTISSVTDAGDLVLATNYAAATATVTYSVSNSIRLSFKGVNLGMMPTN